MIQRAIHPGSVLADRLDHLDLSVVKAARVLRVNRVTLSRFLHGHAGLSADMAVRIDKAFGISLDEMMAIQATYDVAEARRRFTKIRVAPYVAPTPKTGERAS